MSSHEQAMERIQRQLEENRERRAASGKAPVAAAAAPAAPVLSEAVRAGMAAGNINITTEASTLTQREREMATRCSSRSCVLVLLLLARLSPLVPSHVATLSPPPPLLFLFLLPPSLYPAKFLGWVDMMTLAVANRREVSEPVSRVDLFFSCPFSGERMELSGASKEERDKQAALLSNLERKRRMRLTVVPTDDHDVKMALRAMGEPICTFLLQRLTSCSSSLSLSLDLCVSVSLLSP